MVRKSSKSSTKGKKSSTTININLDGVSGTSRVPDGDYKVKVKEASIETNESKGTQYVQFTLTIIDGKHEGKNLRHMNSLQPHALFALRNTLEALNYPIPDGAFDLDLKSLVGLEMGVAVENEEYNGRDQSRVVDVFSAEELEEDEDAEDVDDEEVGEEYEEDDDSDDSDDSDEDDEDDEDEDDEDEEDEDDEDEDEEDDEEGEYEPYTEEELNDMTNEELIELAKDYEIEVPYKGRGAKKRLNKPAVIEAILEAQDEEDED